jgi:chemotaxis protein histidine kinase CheA
MSAPLGPVDFFALEAGEYLEHLAKLAGEPGGPPPEDFVRFSRALRGSALMANQPQIARAAAGLEGVARSYREQTRAWDATLAEIVGQAVDDLKLLVRRSRTWSDEDQTRAQRVAQSLEAISGRPPEGSRPGPPAPVGELNAGVRAFVAREGALVASALDRAARALEAEPDAREPLHNILRRMQSLRGLAALADLSPLPELLDSLEVAVGDLTRSWAPPDGVSEVFDAAAQALTRASRDVAEKGRPDPDATEARRFAGLLLQRFLSERDVVDIETLAPDGTKSIVTLGNAPEPLAAVSLGSVELISHGEFLAQAADELDRTASVTQRHLRLFGLSGALQPTRLGTTAGIGPALERFGAAARQAIADTAAGKEHRGLSAVLRSAGALLRGLTPESDPVAVALDLESLAARVATEPAPAAQAAAGVPEEQVVPIESLALAPPPIEEDTSLAGSFLTYSRLVATGNGPGASLDLLVGGEPAPAAATAAGEPAVLDIGALLYRGEAALRRANAVRQVIVVRLREGADLAGVRPLLDELLDLVPLAIETAT